MPRGVPASGKRQPRPVAAVPVAEPAVAGSALDDTVAEFDTSVAYEEDPADLAPAAVSDLIDTAVPDKQLSPEMQEIKRLRDQLAREKGRKDEEPVLDVIERPGDEGNILIHFLEDGLTVLGKVMYRGDELEFDPKGQAYRDTFNRLGQTWLDLRHNEFAQVDRWGKIMFRSGPWPGKSYADGTFETLRGEREGSSVKPPTAEELAAAEKARAKRAAPRLPVNV
jgi:hypothetical protein